ncbi:MerR family transcriptional regulator [Ohtaekwangia koreensis]|jgi:DNA-binding transcriptional MerR regulator|uniref:DNA-binding transcriptional regulator, MerR family n=1 Tax=Ohtaekwangia koreensis TaxID=688867 RepID=A0A1T5JPB7_9BACT|nr:MerR family transcriptional regulator [Ohtaekwangia koreensis]SKC53093.1 DNA-binding transcriptional regulator, MerR family [Ohtaekwangia koreensis]
MLIGELAQKTNLSRHTIRFYEKLGLIQVPAKSRRKNNYKEYPEETLNRITAIKEITAKGFTLKEARGIITLVNNGTLDAERGRKYLSKKLNLVQKQIDDLTRTKNNLLMMIEQCGTEACEVAQILHGKKIEAETA